MSDLVGNPNCWFSHAQAHLFLFCLLHVYLQSPNKIHNTTQIERISICMQASLFRNSAFKIFYRNFKITGFYNSCGSRMNGVVNNS